MSGVNLAEQGKTREIRKGAADAIRAHVESKGKTWPPKTAQDEIVAALHQDEGNAAAAISSQPLSVKRLEWEHIQKILTENEGNVSATARSLHMHRSVLQRN